MKTSKEFMPRPFWFAAVMGLAGMLETSGCSTMSGGTASSTESLLTPALTTAGGAYIGAKEDNGKPAGAVIGAAAGYVVGEGVNYLNSKSQRAAYQTGYEKGQSDAVKQQYWIARDNQRARTGDGYKEALYEIPVPANDVDGVRHEATTRVIRVVVPNEGAGS